MAYTDSVITYSFFDEINVGNDYAANFIQFIDLRTMRPFSSGGIMIANIVEASDPNASEIIISFGKDAQGNYVRDSIIRPGEIQSFDRRIETQINMKRVTSGSPIPVRVWAW